jgi:bifunctional DNA-binding transcriptional regulator/antitoxin component of YhaV-PrlF toxin-antitoxin module
LEKACHSGGRPFSSYDRPREIQDELVVPRSVRRRAGIKSGDRVEFKVSGGIINIIPNLPTADDEYTPAQRRLIDARIAQARKGPYHGPFKTADEAIAFLNKEIGKRRAAKRKPA